MRGTIISSSPQNKAIPPDRTTIISNFKNANKLIIISYYTPAFKPLEITSPDFPYYEFSREKKVL